VGGGGSRNFFSKKKTERDLRLGKASHLKDFNPGRELSGSKSFRQEHSSNFKEPEGKSARRGSPLFPLREGEIIAKKGSIKNKKGGRKEENQAFGSEPSIRNWVGCRIERGRKFVNGKKRNFSAKKPTGTVN